MHVAWGVVLLRIALRHTSFVATLAELARNEALGRLIGIEKQEEVPDSWNISRFLDVLGREPHFSELRRIFDTMIQRLGLAVPDLGRNTAGDSTALHARSKEKAEHVKAEIAQGLPQPSGGRKEYTDDDGKVIKIVEWFGYKLHLLVDAKHEVVLTYQVTTANAADCKSLPDLVEQGQANLPEGRIETLAYDKAADDNESHRTLHKAKIRAVIKNRHLWKDQTEQMLSTYSSGDEEVRTALQRPHIGGAGQRAFEALLGRGRRQHYRFAAVSRSDRSGADRPCELCDVAGCNSSPGRNAGQIASESHSEGSGGKASRGMKEFSELLARELKRSACAPTLPSTGS